jgi:hypothetical protein
MKRLSALTFVAVIAILAVGSIGWAAEEEVLLSISQPANGFYFVVGESPVISVFLPDQYSREDYSQLRLHVYGPQETTQTKTAVKLLNAPTDRSTSPHHYIDLITDSAVDVKGNMLTYNLQAISDEEFGTYTAGLWVVMNDSTIQSFPLADFQIGTDTVELQIVEREKCGACHLGADNGQYYFHHVDPHSEGDFGYPSIDSWAVRTCKSCHNNDGYAAYRDPDDPNVRIPDPIVHRVHGIHMGANLENPLDNDPNTGVFKDYIHVEFPADVRNCTKCHVDDRWKTEPSREACGACHDNIWFGDPADIPATAEAHPGGRQINDSGCYICHPADGSWTEGTYPAPISTVHKFDLGTEFNVELGMTQPANGTYFVAGEMPQITVTVKNAATGVVVDPATITEVDWNRFRLQVSGPRDHTEPVLTAAAANHELSGSTSYIYNDLRVRTDPADENPGVSRSATEIAYQLADVAGLEAGTYTVFVQLRYVDNPASVAVLNFQVGTETEEQKVCTNCTDCHGDTRMHSSYPFNPDICKNCHDYENQLTGTTGWTDHNWGFGAAPLARRVHGVHYGHYLNKPEEIHGEEDAEEFAGIIFPQDIRNCTKCHDDNPMWKEEPSRVACLACHDSDEAIYHGQLMTFFMMPDDPYSGNEVETCIVCHGSHADFSPDKMHNISNPYLPPYPREPEPQED